MKYNWEFKLECVEKYKSGKNIKVPDESNANYHDFMHMVRDWDKLFDLYGVDGLKNNNKNRILNQEERFECVARVLAGSSIREVAFNNQVGVGTIYQWVSRYKKYGYDGLQLRRGKKPKDPEMTKNEKPKELEKSDYEKLKLLEREVEYLRAENAYLKKLRALIVQKETESSVKAKKRRSSEDSEEKDTD